MEGMLKSNQMALEYYQHMFITHNNMCWERNRIGGCLWLEQNPLRVLFRLFNGEMGWMQAIHCEQQLLETKMRLGKDVIALQWLCETGNTT